MCAELREQHWQCKGGVQRGGGQRVFRELSLSFVLGSSPLSFFLRKKERGLTLPSISPISARGLSQHGFIVSANLLNYIISGSERNLTGGVHRHGAVTNKGRTTCIIFHKSTRTDLIAEQGTSNLGANFGHMSTDETQMHDTAKNIMQIF